MNPLDVTLSDDPEVLEFMRFCHSRKGMLHIDGTHPLPLEQVPVLSDDQLMREAFLAGYEVGKAAGEALVLRGYKVQPDEDAKEEYGD